MKLYYLPGACSLADHIALYWSQLPFEAEAVPREQLKGEFLKINPAGSVPAMALDDGTVLTQNLAILNYIADLAPGANLAGTTPRERAEVLRWTAFVNADIHRFFSLIFGAGRLLAGEAAQNELIESSRTALRGLFETANAQLGNGNGWLANGTRSIADTYLFVVLRWAKAKNINLSGLDHLDTFSARMREDEGVKRAMAAEGLA
jgi:glutathione S-transferase